MRTVIRHPAVTQAAVRRAGAACPALAARAGPALAGLGLGLLALGPGLRRGFLLSYDMVVVPREPFSAAMAGAAGGPPRAVPSDAVVAAASRVLPADIVQKLLLLSVFVLACSGAAALLAREPWFARLAAGVFYAWNPFVAERLIIGQWALLLGYAGLPWAVRAAQGSLTTWRGAGRLGLALLPAAIGGFAAMTVSALAVLPVAVLARGSTPPSPGDTPGPHGPEPPGAPMGPAGKPAGPIARLARGSAPPAPGERGGGRGLAAGGVALGVLALGSLPWLIPSLLHTVYADPAGVAAFAARPDTPFGSLGSLAMLGGMWNAQAVPAGYGGGWSVFWLGLVAAAAVGYVAFAARQPCWPGGALRYHRGIPPDPMARNPPGRRWVLPASRQDPSRGWPGLGLAAVAGFVIAALGATAPGRDLLRALASAWPGFAVLRDGQQFAAPLALAEALGAGLVAAWVARPARRLAPDRPGLAIAVCVLVAPVLLLPGLAWGAAGRLHPAWYPAAWLNAARVIDTGPARGSVLLLPWTAYRRPPWNGGRAVLDPWPRLLARPVIWNDGPLVGGVQMRPDDPAARRLDGIVRAPGPLTAALAAAGVRFVVVDGGAGAAGRLPGCPLAAVAPGLAVYRVAACRHLVRPGRIPGPRAWDRR